MSAFNFEALAADGRIKRGVLESDSARQARAQLREKGLIPLAVEAIAEGTAPSVAGFGRRALGANALALVTRQLSTLLGAGLTIEQTLNALIEQAETQRERQLLAAVRGDVLAGQPLARALARHPSTFPDLYRTLVDAGERAGRLPDVLLRLADYTEDSAALRGKVLLAFVYPALVTLVAVAVVSGLLVFVVPQVVRVFENSHQALPFLTRALIAVSALVRGYGVYLLAGLGAAAVALRQALRSPSVRARWHRFLLRLPVIGALHRSLNSARLASTLAILVASRVPLTTALRAGEGTVSNLPMRAALAAAGQRVEQGSTLARALGASQLFPPLMVHMIASGEASGRLAEMLERTATQQARDLERRVGVFMSLLEPMLILAMGAVVLVIVLAILQPVFELNTIVR
ncbi:MAG TPA: type II secretion system inner membrane protein GspF [Burkholderiales bacterium]|nr:type II secretion system inner membrane protein GspF [Betaproteobacteria bacterium]HQR52389.1 type II secretion system inner membrane protein GspF [Burkholderiales bacterium]